MSFTTHIAEVSASAFNIPDDMLVKGKGLQVVELTSAVSPAPARDFMVFVDNTDGSQSYLPTFRPLIFNLVRDLTQRGNRVDVFSINSGITHLTLSGNPADDVGKILTITHVENEKSIELAEMFFTVNDTLRFSIERAEKIGGLRSTDDGSFNPIPHKTAVPNRLTVILFAFSEPAPSGTNMAQMVNDFRGLVDKVGVDVYVVHPGALAVSNYYALSMVGNLPGGYLGLLFQYDEALALKNKNLKAIGSQKDVYTTDVKLEQFADDLARESADCIETLAKLVVQNARYVRIRTDANPWLSAPVSGRVVLPATGEISIMVGGETPTLLPRVSAGAAGSSTVQPSTVQPSTVESNTAYSITVQPSTVQPITVQPITVPAVKFALCVSIRSVLMRFEKTNHEELSRHIEAGKRKGVWGASLGVGNYSDVQSLVSLFNSLLIAVITGDRKRMQEFARVASKCTKMMSSIAL